MEISLKLLGPILYKILCTLLNDGYAKYVYNNRHRSSFPGQLRHISMKKKWCTKFVHKTNDIKRYRVISPHIKIRPWHRGWDECIITLTSLLIKVIMFWEIKNKPVYILFTYISEVCYVYNWCITCGLNKPDHSGNESKRFPSLNIPMMHLVCFFVCP